MAQSGQHLKIVPESARTSLAPFWRRVLARCDRGYLRLLQMQVPRERAYPAAMAAIALIAAAGIAGLIGGIR